MVRDSFGAIHEKSIKLFVSKYFHGFREEFHLFKVLLI